jgi:hypothetical protein
MFTLSRCSFGRAKNFKYFDVIFDIYVEKFAETEHFLPGVAKRMGYTCPPTRFASGTIVAGGAREKTAHHRDHGRFAHRDF